jgi:hypothetical protein
MMKAYFFALFAFTLLLSAVSVSADIVHPRFEPPAYHPTYLPDWTQLAAYGFNTVQFLVSLLLTVAIELGITFASIRLMKVKNVRRVLITVLIANLITVPIVWFLFPIIQIFTPQSSIYNAYIFVEAIAIAIEGAMLAFFNKKDLRTNAFILSIVMNVSSFLIGTLVFYAVQPLI